MNGYGVFRKYDEGFDGDMFKYGLKHALIYNEALAGAKNSLTGQRFPGSPKYFPDLDSAGNSLQEQDKEYPFYVISYKTSLHTQSRSLWHASTMELYPENFILMNGDDAKRLKLKSGEEVRMFSRNNREGVKGKVQITQTVRPGCIAVSFHYGHTQFGGSELNVRNAEAVFLGGASVANGDRLIPDLRYRAGVNSNMLSRLDPNLSNTPLVDLVAGIPDFSNTRVKVVRG